MREIRHSLGEEIANSVSHGVGLVVGTVAGSFLVASAVAHDKPWGTLAASIFVATMVTTYLASSLYHALPPGRGKRVFRKLEYCAIFLLIAGTYTPFTLVALRGGWGWTLFGLVWLLAILGILLEVMVATKPRWLSGLLYVALAWFVVIAIRPLLIHVPQAGLLWLLAGGIAYTAGIAFFAAKFIPYGHFIWHLFVMAGTACHFIAIWCYVI